MTVNHPPFLTALQRRAQGSLCSHGYAGYCHDDALPVEREAFEALYRHAYDYAAYSQRLQPSAAEHYAAYYASTYFQDCVDWGTPGSAYGANGVHEVIPAEPAVDLSGAPNHSLETLYGSGVISR